MDDKLKQLYDALETSADFKGIFVSQEDMVATLNEDVDAFFNIINSSNDFSGIFSNADDFASSLGLKKKEDSSSIDSGKNVQGSPLGSQLSAKGSLGVQSPSPSTEEPAPQSIPEVKPTAPAGEQKPKPITSPNIQEVQDQFPDVDVPAIDDTNILPKDITLKEFNAYAYKKNALWSKKYAEIQDKLNEDAKKLAEKVETIEEFNTEAAKLEEKAKAEGEKLKASYDDYIHLADEHVKTIEEEIKNIMQSGMNVEQKQSALADLKKYYTEVYAQQSGVDFVGVEGELNALIARRSLMSGAQLSTYALKTEALRIRDGLQMAEDKHKLSASKYVKDIDNMGLPEFASSDDRNKYYSIMAEAGKLSLAVKHLNNALRTPEISQGARTPALMETMDKWFTAGLSGLLESGAVGAAAQRQAEGRATDADEALIDATGRLKQLQGIASQKVPQYRRAKSVFESIPYMEQFVLTSFMGKIAIGAAEKAAAAVLGNKFKTKAAQTITEFAAKRLLAPSVEGAVSMVGRVPLSPATYQNIIEARTPIIQDDKGNFVVDVNNMPSLVSAINTGIKASAADIFSESLGGTVPFPKWKYLNKIFSPASRKIFRASGLNGLGGEWGEEIYSALFQGEQINKDFLIDLALTVPAMTGGFAVLASPQVAQNMMWRADAKAVIDKFGKDNVAELRALIENENMDGFIKKMEGLISEEGANKKDVSNLILYVGSLVQSKAGQKVVEAGGQKPLPKDVKVIDKVKIYPQQTTYDCGVTATQGALSAFGIETDTKEMTDRIQPTEAEGAKLGTLVDVIKEKGLNAEMKTGMTQDDLRQSIDNGTPVIILQNGVRETDPNKDYSGTDEGHYVTVKGYNKDGFVFADPSSETGDLFMTNEDLQKRWHGYLDDGQTIANGIGIVVTKGAEGAVKGAMPQTEQDGLAEEKISKASKQTGGQKDAERTGTETMETGAETTPGMEQGETTGVRVRDTEENGLETKPGEEVTKKGTPISDAVDKYDFGKDTTFSDLVDEVESIAEEQGNKKLLKAIARYRSAVDEDRFEYGMRSGLPEEAEEKLDVVIRAEAGKEKAIKEKKPKPKLTNKKGTPQRERVKQEILSVGSQITPEQVDAVLTLFDTQAKVFAQTLGKTEEDYYSTIDIKGEEAASTQAKQAQKEGRVIRGQYQFIKGRDIITLMRSGNVSTALHEIAGHRGRRLLGQLAVVDKTWARRQREVEKWAGVKDGKWHIGAEEKFARAFELYVRTGGLPQKAPSALRQAFDKLVEWMKELYADTRVLGTMSPSVRNTFDALLGVDSKVIIERGTNAIRKPTTEKEGDALFQTAEVEREISINAKTKKVKVYEVSIQPEQLSKLPDGETAKQITTINEARLITANEERVKDWQSIYSKAEKMDESKLKKQGQFKLATVPIIDLTQGCLRALTTIERVENGILPVTTRVESCYEGTCWVNKQFNAKFSKFENMEARDIALIDPNILDKFVAKNKAFLRQGQFIRHGQRGDDSHAFATGLALEWLKACQKHNIITSAQTRLPLKNVFISAAYAPVTEQQYRDLLPYRDLFVIHFSNSGWFHKNEIMIRLAEYLTAKEVGLDAKIRIISNKSNISGIEMPNTDWLIEQMRIRGVPNEDILETPYHDDGIKKKAEQDRSEAIGIFKYVCCESGKCLTCSAKCMTHSLLDMKPIDVTSAHKEQADSEAESISEAMFQEDGDALFQSTDGVAIINGFYSPLEKRISDFKQDRASVNKWKDIVGMKTDEATFTGLAEWLNSLPPQQILGKNEVQQFLTDNRIEVQEKTLGGFEGEIKWSEPKFSGGQKVYHSDSGLSIIEYYNREKNETYPYRFLLVKDNDEVGWYNTLAEAQGAAMGDKNQYAGTTKFSTYQLAGEKRNYKEVLVLLPAKEETGFEKWYKGKEWDFYNKEEAMMAYERSTAGKSEPDFGKFTASHWEEPNVLVHLRMNERVDAEGKNILFLEEIQSDWGQKGKKEGFRDEKAIQQAKDDIKKADDEFQALYRDPNITHFLDLWGYNNITGKFRNQLWDEGERNLHDKINTVIEKQKLASERFDEVTKAKIPQSPFVTDTNSWVKLGLKYALRHAVRSGADKIAWTTGEQQNERYDLSKQVDEIQYFKSTNPKSGYDYSIQAFRGGQKVIAQDVLEKDLEGLVGKEMAEKIIKDEGGPIKYGEENISKVEGEGSLKGEQLKVGGKGMIGFYGSPAEGSLGIVGNVAKKVFGQEPKVTKISIGENKYVNPEDVNEDMFGNSLPPSEGQEAEYEAGQSIQHSIDITSQLVEEVEDGLPLFQEDKPTKEERRKKKLAESIDKVMRENPKLTGRDLQDAVMEEFLSKDIPEGKEDAAEAWVKKSSGYRALAPTPMKLSMTSEERSRGLTPEEQSAVDKVALDKFKSEIRRMVIQAHGTHVSDVIRKRINDVLNKSEEQIIGELGGRIAERKEMWAEAEAEKKRMQSEYDAEMRRLRNEYKEVSLFISKTLKKAPFATKLSRMQVRQLVNEARWVTDLDSLQEFLAVMDRIVGDTRYAAEFALAKKNQKAVKKRTKDASIYGREYKAVVEFVSLPLRVRDFKSIGDLIEYNRIATLLQDRIPSEGIKALKEYVPPQISETDSGGIREDINKIKDRKSFDKVIVAIGDMPMETTTDYRRAVNTIAYLREYLENSEFSEEIIADFERALLLIEDTINNRFLKIEKEMEKLKAELIDDAIELSSEVTRDKFEDITDEQWKVIFEFKNTSKEILKGMTLAQINLFNDIMAGLTEGFSNKYMSDFNREVKVRQIMTVEETIKTQLEGPYQQVREFADRLSKIPGLKRLADWMAPLSRLDASHIATMMNLMKKLHIEEKFLAMYKKGQKVVFEKILGPLYRAASNARNDFDGAMSKYWKAANEVKKKDRKKIGVLMSEMDFRSRPIIIGDKEYTWDTLPKGEKIDRIAWAIREAKTHNELIQGYIEVYDSLIKDKDGNIDIEANLTEMFKDKKIKNYYDTIRSILKTFEGMAQVATEKRGAIWETYPNYFPAFVIEDPNATGFDYSPKTIEDIASSRRFIRKRAKSTYQRTNERYVIDYDIDKAVGIYVSDVTRDYWVADELTVINTALDRLKAKSTVKEASHFYDALRQSITDAAKVELVDKSTMKDMAAMVDAWRTAKLAKLHRPFIEAMANATRYFLLHGVQIDKHEVFKDKDKWKQVFTTLGSPLMLKVSRWRDQEIYDPERSKVKQWAENLYTFADTHVGRAVFINEFVLAFEEKSGHKFNKDKFLTDEQYRSDNREALSYADAQATAMIETMLGSQTWVTAPSRHKYVPFISGRSKRTAFAIVSRKSHLAVNLGVMMSFNFYETQEALLTLRTILTPGVDGATKAQAIRKLSTFMFTNYMYMFAMRAMGILISNLIPGDDDDDDLREEFSRFFTWEYQGKLLAGSITSLGLGRYGNAARLLAGFGLGVVKPDKTAPEWLKDTYQSLTDTANLALNANPVDPNARVSRIKAIQGIGFLYADIVAGAAEQALDIKDIVKRVRENGLDSLNPEERELWTALSSVNGLIMLIPKLSNAFSPNLQMLIDAKIKDLRPAYLIEPDKDSRTVNGVDIMDVYDLEGLTGITSRPMAIYSTGDFGDRQRIISDADLKKYELKARERFDSYVQQYARDNQVRTAIDKNNKYLADKHAEEVEADMKAMWSMAKAQSKYEMFEYEYAHTSSAFKWAARMNALPEPRNSIKRGDVNILADNPMLARKINKSFIKYYLELLKEEYPSEAALKRAQGNKNWYLNKGADTSEFALWQKKAVSEALKRAKEDHLTDTED